jgi:hypothetical protein
MPTQGSLELLLMPLETSRGRSEVRCLGVRDLWVQSSPDRAEVSLDVSPQTNDSGAREIQVADDHRLSFVCERVERGDLAPGEGPLELAFEPSDWRIKLVDGSMLTVWADAVHETSGDLVFNSLINGLPGSFVEVLRIPTTVVADYRNDGSDGYQSHWRVDPRAEQSALDA